MKQVRLILWLLLGLTVLMTGCRPKGILHSWEMRAVLIDLHKTDALLQVAGVKVNEMETRNIYYAMVLEKHEITQAEFDSSLVWYTAHPKIFDKIYPKVLKELKAEEEAFNELHSDELAIKTGPFGKSSSKQAKPKHTFTPAQLDSVLQVMQHGHPSSWYPSMQNTEEEFFPQIPILR